MSTLFAFLRAIEQLIDCLLFCFFRQMVQAIQVLRFHLLELEKVNKYVPSAGIKIVKVKQHPAGGRASGGGAQWRRLNRRRRPFVGTRRELSRAGDGACERATPTGAVIIISPVTSSRRAVKRSRPGRLVQSPRAVHTTTRFLTLLFVCGAGSRAVRQLLPPLHQLPQGQDAHRPRDRRTGRLEQAGPRRHEQQLGRAPREGLHRGHEPHGRLEHSRRGEFSASRRPRFRPLSARLSSRRTASDDQFRSVQLFVVPLAGK